MKNCEFCPGDSMELLVRLCLTLLEIFVFVGLLKYECVSIRFYILLSLNKYIIWIYYSLETDQMSASVLQDIMLYNPLWI